MFSAEYPKFKSTAEVLTVDRLRLNTLISTNRFLTPKGTTSTPFLKGPLSRTCQLVQRNVWQGERAPRWHIYHTLLHTHTFG